MKQILSIILISLSIINTKGQNFPSGISSNSSIQDVKQLYDLKPAPLIGSNGIKNFNLVNKVMLNGGWLTNGMLQFKNGKILHIYFDIEDKFNFKLVHDFLEKHYPKGKLPNTFIFNGITYTYTFPDQKKDIYNIFPYAYLIIEYPKN